MFYLIISIMCIILSAIELMQTKPKNYNKARKIMARKDLWGRNE